MNELSQIKQNYFTSNDGSQNTFVYQPALDTLQLKKDKGTDYVLSCKSKGVFNSKLKLLYTAFLQRTKLFEHRIRIKFDNGPLSVEPNNYFSKILNVYIVYDLHPWPRNPTSNFKFKNCLFGATNIVKIVIKKVLIIVFHLILTIPIITL